MANWKHAPTLALDYCPDAPKDRQFFVHILHSDGKVQSEGFKYWYQATSFSNGFKEGAGQHIASWPSTAFTEIVNKES